MNPTNSTERLLDHFQSLQQHIQTGQRQAALEPLNLLLQAPLQPYQRSLVLQLQGDLLHASGKREQALEVWCTSLSLRYSPQLTFLCLEMTLLPAVNWQQQQQWTAWMRSLVEHGQGMALIRWLRQLLHSYPLQQQRDELLYHLDRDDVLGLVEHTELMQVWKRLRRCAAPQ